MSRSSSSITFHKFVERSGLMVVSAYN
ncbi:unnamed protein product [Allacma fusca]|uniref:Uncharacterized protein n=1 Tax=Allacma fusca TaxID=39272 RepID=A0A8J2JP83_9HEXA|nr:unnamed protein product [Allacma fusca]